MCMGSLGSVCYRCIIMEYWTMMHDTVGKEPVLNYWSELKVRRHLPSHLNMATWPYSIHTSAHSRAYITWHTTADELGLLQLSGTMLDIEYPPRLLLLPVGHSTCSITCRPSWPAPTPFWMEFFCFKSLRRLLISTTVSLHTVLESTCLYQAYSLCSVLTNRFGDTNEGFNGLMESYLKAMSSIWLVDVNMET